MTVEFIVWERWYTKHQLIRQLSLGGYPHTPTSFMGTSQSWVSVSSNKQKEVVSTFPLRVLRYTLLGKIWLGALHASVKRLLSRTLPGCR